MVIVIHPMKSFTGVFIPNWLSRSNIVSDSSKIIYGRLCQYAGEQLYAFPKVPTLAEETGKSVRAVYRYLAELKEENLIYILNKGKRASFYYFIKHPQMTFRKGYDALTERSLEEALLEKAA